MRNWPTNDSKPFRRTGPSTATPANRIGSVTHDDGKGLFLRGAEAVGHRIDVGVDARPDVLKVDHQELEVGQHLGRRLAGIAVERVHRDAVLEVAPMRRLYHVVLDARVEAMLGAEDRRQRGPRGRHLIECVVEVGVDRGGIADESDPAPRKLFLTQAGCPNRGAPVCHSSDVPGCEYFAGGPSLAGTADHPRGFEKGE